MSHTVVLAKPDSASWMDSSPSRLDAAIASSTTAPAGKGRVISAQTVLANTASRPQLRAGKPACGTSQTAPAAASGISHRQRSAGRVAGGTGTEVCYGTNCPWDEIDLSHMLNRSELRLQECPGSRG